MIESCDIKDYRIENENGVFRIQTKVEIYTRFLWHKSIKVEWRYIDTTGCPLFRMSLCRGIVLKNHFDINPSYDTAKEAESALRKIIIINIRKKENIDIVQPQKITPTYIYLK